MNTEIVLTVTNPGVMESGLSVQVRIGSAGGVIGAASSSDWVLKSRDGSIADTYGRVIWLDDQFCIEDLSGDVLLNGASLALGKGRRARLNDNDMLAVGPYQVRVNQRDAEAAALEGASLGSFFDGGDERLVAAVSPAVGEADERAVDAIDDPLLALGLRQEGAGKHDLAGDLKTTDENDDNGLLADQLLRSNANITIQADTDFDTSSAIGPKHRTYTDKIMDDNELDLLESEVARGLHPETSSTDSVHLATGPMLRGLGVQLDGGQDTGKQQALAVEMGAALQAAIKGLLQLHQTAQGSRYDLINKNLQPIEDNPLRLGQAYEDTVRTLFDDHKSPVHLAPAAAIEESLRSVEHHNEAVQYAITEALNYILSAFAPETLLRRFSQYRKVSDSVLAQGDQWAWQMYENYYQELASTRQQGFRKLFWEVFEQAYDRKLRELQRSA